VFEVFFKPLTDRDNPKWVDGVNKVICVCGSVQKTSSNGFTSCVQHVHRKHNDWESVRSEYVEAKGNGQITILDFTSVSKKARHIYEWFKWIIENNLPFSFVEKKRTRANVNLDPISRTTFMKYLRLVTLKVEQKLRVLLTDKNFGSILDGWTENSFHFCVLLRLFLEHLIV
jgi:hypothetical protein